MLSFFILCTSFSLVSGKQLPNFLSQEGRKQPVYFSWAHMCCSAREWTWILEVLFRRTWLKSTNFLTGKDNYTQWSWNLQMKYNQLWRTLNDYHTRHINVDINIMDFSSVGKSHLFATVELKTKVVHEVVIRVAQKKEHCTRMQGSYALMLPITK